MKVRIQVLRNNSTLRHVLARNGWQREDVSATEMSISHPEIRDEESARHRLALLGLLTSNKLRIGFPRHR
jgi:hypothetical protein